MDTLICDQCGHKFASIEGEPGKQKLTVYPPQMSITIVTREPLIGEVECPECHNRMTILAEWMRRF